MPPAPDASIIPAAPVGLVGSILLTALLIAAAGWLSWLFVIWASRDLDRGNGPLFLYKERWRIK
jgi:hypothetical protein